MYVDSEGELFIFWEIIFSPALLAEKSIVTSTDPGFCLVEINKY